MHTGQQERHHGLWPLHLVDCGALPVRDQQLHHSGAQGGAGPGMQLNRHFRDVSKPVPNHVMEF